MKPFRIHQIAATASTNDDAKHAAESGEPEGLVVWALKQTSGRGRHGRVWESPEGNLYCSVLLRPAIEPHAMGQYSFVAALTLYDAVESCLRHSGQAASLCEQREPESRLVSIGKKPNGMPAFAGMTERKITLKWPNDVLVDGKKISGILLESGAGWLVVGMGLNVLHHPDNAIYPSTSLSEAGARQVDLSKTLDSLLDHLGHWHNVMQDEGFASIRTAWLDRAQKGAMTVRLPDETLEGTFIDIDGNGNLRLRLADGSERSIATGDVFFTPKD